MEQLHIIAEEIPEHVFDTGCRVLYRSVKAALEDPALRAECEKWKKERERERDRSADA